MIVDTHCHVDMLDSPELYLKEKEQFCGLTIAMTNLPSHFLIGSPFFKGAKNSHIALGFHPQLAEEHINELEKFKELVPLTSYIGEVGLDYSKDYIASKNKQLFCFDFICRCIQGTKKIVSVHSRRAEKDVLAILKQYAIKNVIFHWYSGPLGLIEDIINEGYYFSLNEAMTISESGKKILKKIPRERILTESDAPYNIHTSITKAIRNIEVSESLIYDNYKTLIAKIK